jgi:hypothetical protein
LFDAGDKQLHGEETVVMMEGMKRLDRRQAVFENSLLILFVDLLWSRLCDSPSERTLYLLS